jgi:hypothetical protein
MGCLQAQLPFSVDLTYSSSFPSQYAVGVGSLIPYPDGRALIAGSWSDDNPYTSDRKRLLADGSDDTGFAIEDAVYHFDAWNEGAFYGRRSYVKRYHMYDGSVDEQFQHVSTEYGGPFEVDYLDGLSVAPDGSLFMCGGFYVNDTTSSFFGYYDLVKISPTGHLDTSFVPIVTTPFVPGTHVLADGRILVHGTHLYNGVFREGLYIVHPDGSLDESFEPTGFHNARLTTAELLPDGKLLVTGRLIRYQDLLNLDTLHVVRFMPDGSLDPTFDHELRPRDDWNQGYYTTVNSILRIDEDRYLISGTFGKVNGIPRGGLAMLDANGHLIEDEIDWPGAGTVDGRRSIRLARHPFGGIFLYGLFNGFNDGQLHDVQGVVLLHGINLGLVDPAEHTGPRVHPNPSIGEITISLPKDAKHVLIFEQHGSLVMETNVPAGSSSLDLDLDHLTPGSYYARCGMTNGSSFTQKFIIIP